MEENYFKINPYDPCVANKWMRGAQLTVARHVDNLKVSLKGPQCITSVNKWLSTLYDDLKETRGEVHNCLGITLDYIIPGFLWISMVAYINEILANFPEVIEGAAGSPTPNNLFLVQDDTQAIKLPEEQAVNFHHTVVQLLFLSTKAQRDIQVAIALLTTRVKHPEEDNWGKLKQVLKVLKQTENMHFFS